MCKTHWALEGGRILERNLERAHCLLDNLLGLPGLNIVKRFAVPCVYVHVWPNSKLLFTIYFSFWAARCILRTRGLLKTTKTIAQATLQSVEEDPKAHLPNSSHWHLLVHEASAGRLRKELTASRL